MCEYKNPFEYEAATNLPPEMIIDVYIEDYNYTRFIQSKRNVFLLGERGSGKSMTLLYNSFEIKKLKAEKNGNTLSLDYIGIYIPCNTPLTHKQEHQLLSHFQASVISEHYLVLSILYYLANTITHIQGITKDFEESSLRTEIEYILGDTIPTSSSFFEAIKTYVQAQLTRTQQEMNKPGPDSFYENTFTFSSAVLPLLNVIKKIPELKSSHFLLMIDDAHDLNNYQRRALNSWIAYRDHSLYSFKVATAKLSDFDFRTSSGGSILEGHDFITIDMEGDFQNQYSRFGKLVKDIIQRRLLRIGVSKLPEDFFPINSDFLKELEDCKIRARDEAAKKYSIDSGKQIDDYVYKFARALYFRERSRKANRPPYSGFETIIHLSTGVIRNLLEPCYWMYDYAYSAKKDHTNSEVYINITEIPSSIQTEVILEMSKKMWQRLENGLENVINGCSKEQGKQIHSLFDNLAILFIERLLKHKSEPRAIVFTISGMTEEYESLLIPLIDIARKAQLLYLRMSVAKTGAKLETYYVPNRMLWPIKGLDPVGQHARVSLKAIDILNAVNGKKFPFVETDDVPVQGVLF